MAGIKIFDLPPLGRDLASTDLLELSLAGGTGSRKITGQEIMNASKLSINNTPIINGTVGRVLFQGTGDVLQQSSSLFWDATNNRLGIGTSTPSDTLSVNGNLTLLNLLGTNRSTQLSTSGSSDNLPSISFYPATGTNVGQSFDIIPKGTGYSSGIKTQFGIWGTDFIANQTNYELLLVRATGSSYTFESFKGGTGAHRPILLSAGVSNQLWAYTSGNIGINTTTDAGFRLDVNGTARATSYTLGNYIINQASANQFIVSNPTGASGQLFLYGGTTSQANIQIYGSSGGNTNNILFNVGSTVRSVIFGSTGNVGINTTTDDGFRLDVNGTARVQGNTLITQRLAVAKTTAANNTLEVQNPDAGAIPNLGVNESSAIWFGSTYGLMIGKISNGNTWLQSTRVDGSATAYNILLQPRGGNVLINTTTDAGFRLDVNGTARVSGQFDVISGTANFRVNNTSTYVSLGFGSTAWVQYNANETYIQSTNIFFQNASSILYASGRGIFGSSSLGNSAQFQIDSTTRGFLPPRMTQAQRNAIASPAIGLEIYQTDATEGKYIYKSSGWTYIG